MPMATTQLTAANFESVVTSNDVVLIDFWAEWCGPCKMFGPIFEKVSEQFPDLVFAKVDTEAEQQLAGTFNIMSIPTLMIVREQVVVYSQPGAVGEVTLVDIVNQAMALDMEEVHREVAAQQAAQPGA
jgi:thioredoxin 1